jgi:hypothetical protein
VYNIAQIGWAVLPHPAVFRRGRGGHFFGVVGVGCAFGSGWMW